ncbi:nuclear condensing complex subunit [Gymnopilus junonius]|uniref:Nuclear condensing complex subunit n=1 Tax=Gymnopilus junonius TaxID=109634 RepID=A0A9P5NRG2_GYMJU|nr:nuclear condensing complex subunit [Gymnopilus junonius]
MHTTSVNPSIASPFNGNQQGFAVRRIFDQAQISYANHRKNHVALFKLHTEYAAHKEFLNKGRSMKLTGERQFERLFHHLVLCVLPMKKGVVSADRIVKFIAGYIKFINEKADLEDNSDESDDEDETTASRFTEKLIKFLLPGFLAKNKNVRYRALQIVAEMISYLGQIDEDIFRTLRTALINRLDDRESAIRSQAVISLGKLSASEDPGVLDEEPSVIEMLLDVMSKDDSVDVRRTAILTIPINTETLPAVLDRMHDTDTTIRTTVYSKVLSTNLNTEEHENSDIIGPAHPYILTISQRAHIIQTGLDDRDLSVSSAAAALIASWVDVLTLKSANEEIKVEELKEKPETNVLSFLNLFDLEDGSIAEKALLSIFNTRPDIFGDIDFDDHYWANLTPEKAFLARVFVECCKVKKDDTRLEATMPVVTHIAFRIQEEYNMLDDFFLPTPFNEGLIDDSQDKREKEALSRKIVISELLKLAVHLDYSDEIGRRKTFELVRGMLRSEILPEMIIPPCLDVLRVLSATEGQLIRLVVETIQELREAIHAEVDVDIPEEDIDLETSSLSEHRQNAPLTRNQDMSPEQKLLADEVDLKCLLMCIGVLERVNGTLEKNITLEAILKDLIVPYVEREELIFQERAMKSLGLCCLIAQPLAFRSILPFMAKVPSSTPLIKVTLLQCIFDIFMVHETTIFKNKETTLEVVTKFLLANILQEQDPNVKAVLCEGTAKLVYSGLITSIEAIRTLIKTYLSPLTVGNQRLRQYLSVFFMTYSHSSPENQKRMGEIFIHVFLDASEDRKNNRDATINLETIGSSHVAAMFTEWTDPLLLADALKAESTQNERAVNYCIQIKMAEDILKVLFEKDLKVDIESDKRVLCQLLNSLHIPDVVDDYRIRSLKLLMDTLKIRRPLRDSACKTAFSKFESTITEKFEKQLEGFSEAEYRKLEELNGLFEFLDSIIPLDNEYVDVDIPRKGRKRSVMTMIGF